MPGGKGELRPIKHSVAQGETGRIVSITLPLQVAQSTRGVSAVSHQQNTRIVHRSRPGDGTTTTTTTRIAIHECFFLYTIYQFWRRISCALCCFATSHARWVDWSGRQQLSLTTKRAPTIDPSRPGLAATAVPIVPTYQCRWLHQYSLTKTPHHHRQRWPLPWWCCCCPRWSRPPLRRHDRHREFGHHQWPRRRRMVVVQKQHSYSAAKLPPSRPLASSSSPSTTP